MTPRPRPLPPFLYRSIPIALNPSKVLRWMVGIGPFHLHEYAASKKGLPGIIHRMSVIQLALRLQCVIRQTRSLNREHVRYRSAPKHHPVQDRANTA